MPPSPVLHPSSRQGSVFSRRSCTTTIREQSSRILLEGWPWFRPLNLQKWWLPWRIPEAHQTLWAVLFLEGLWGATSGFISTIKTASLWRQSTIEIDIYPSCYLPRQHAMPPDWTCFLIHKQYNQAFGDLVPLMFANVLHVNIRILERRDSEGHYNMVTVGPSDLPSLVILVIHKHGEHCSTLLLSPFTWWHTSLLQRERCSMARGKENRG